MQVGIIPLRVPAYAYGAAGGIGVKSLFGIVMAARCQHPESTEGEKMSWVTIVSVPCVPRVCRLEIEDRNLKRFRIIERFKVYPRFRRFLLSN